jgi:hypothetical protein
MNNLPAFPVFPDTSGGHAAAFQGMTLRDYMAAKAMQCITPILYESFDSGTVHERIAHDAYLFADAMLKAREE